MGVKLPESMRQTKKVSEAAKAASDDNSLISSIINGSKNQGSSKEEKSSANNKNGTLGILGRGVKELLPSIAKGVTSTIDDLADVTESYRYAYDQKKAEQSGRYSLMEKAAQSKELYQKAASKHVLGDKVEAWEEDVDERRAKIVEDNPDSKLAVTTAKALGLGESVGRMLPSVGLSMVTGGVGGAVVGQAVGLGTMAMSVYDSSFDESMEKGYDTVSAGKKALGDAMLETGTELLFGGIAGLGKGVINANTTRRFTDMVNKVGASEAADKAVRKFGVKGAVLGLSRAAVRASEAAEEKTFRGLMLRSFGEGAEEMISEAISPFIERATVNPHADDATFEEIVEAGIGGALISFAMAPLGRIETQLDARKQARAAREQEVEAEAIRDERLDFKANDVEYQYAMLNNIAFDEVASPEDVAIAGHKFGLSEEEMGTEGVTFKLRHKTSKRLASEYIRKARESGSTPEAMAELWTNFKTLIDEETDFAMTNAASEKYKQEVLSKRAEESEETKNAWGKFDEANRKKETVTARIKEMQSELDKKKKEKMATLDKETESSTDVDRSILSTRNKINASRRTLRKAEAEAEAARAEYDSVKQENYDAIDREMKSMDIALMQEQFGEETVNNFLAYQRIEEMKKGRVIVLGKAYTKNEYEASPMGMYSEETFEELLAKQEEQARAELQSFADEANKGLAARGLGDKLSVNIVDTLESGDRAQYVDGVISFAADKVYSPQAAQYYMAHEMLHAMSDKILSQEGKDAFYEDIVDAAKAVGFDYDGWYAKVAGIYSPRYEGLDENKKAAKFRDETCARFMQTAFGSQSILESMSLVNPEMVEAMKTEIEQSSAKRFDKSIWDYERLKILDHITNALARPRDAESNAEKIQKDIKQSEAEEAKDAEKAEATKKKAPTQKKAKKKDADAKEAQEAQAEEQVEVQEEQQVEVQEEQPTQGFVDIDSEAITPERLRQYEELKAKYGSFDKRGLPKQINSNVATSQFANNVFRSKKTDDTLKQRMQSDLLDGAYTHLIMTDKDAISKANEFIRNKGTMSAAYTSVRDILQNGSINKNDIATGEQMLIEVRDRINEINKENENLAPDEQKSTEQLYDMFEGLLADLCAAGTRAGQNLQAFSLLKKMTPQGRLYHIDSQVTSLLEEMYEKRGKGFLIDRSGASMVGGYRFMKDGHGNYLKDSKGNMIEIKVSDELRDKMLNCTTAEELDAVEAEIITDIASQIPSTIMDRVSAWRYLAMLGNPRTHVRNIVSNIVMGSTIKVKNRVGGALEDIFLANETVGRTKSLHSALTAEQKAEVKEFAEKDWVLDGMSDEALSGGKIGFQSRIRQEMKTLGFGDFTALDDVAKFNSNLLEAEDNWSGKKAFIEAYATYCSAQGLTAEFLKSGTVEANKRLAQTRSYACREAAKATYHDANLIATHLNQLEKSSGALGKLIIGGLLPFKKTPVNILRRGLEYSPFSLATGLCKTVARINTPVENFEGEYSALNSEDALNLGLSEARMSAAEKKTKAVADAIDELASGLTGTGVMLLGMLAGQLGLMKASGSDNDKEEYYDQMLGNQQYSITIGGTNYTLDWLTPLSMLLFAGVEYANYAASDQSGEEEVDWGSKFEAYVSALAKMADPVTNLSVLQGVNDALSSYEGGITKFAISAAESYAGQFVPTLAGQIARSIDPIRRSTYAPKTGETNLGKKVNTFINRMENKIPGLSQDNAAYVDMWGRTEENAGGSFIGRLFANSVAPWYSKKENKTEADDYITALFSVTNDRSVIPNTLEKSYTFDGEKVYMESDEYQQEQEIVGQLSHIGVTSLMSVKGYGDLTPDEQATLVGKAYEFAKAVARADYAKSKGYPYEEESPITRTKEAVKAGLSIGEALYIDYVAHGFKSDKNSNGNSIKNSRKKKVLNFYYSMGLTDEQIEAINIYDDTIIR